MLLEVYALTDVSDLFYGNLTHSIQTCSQLTKLFNSFYPTTSIFTQSYQLALNCRIYLTNQKISLCYQSLQTFYGAIFHLEMFF